MTGMSAPGTRVRTASSRVSRTGGISGSGELPRDSGDRKQKRATPRTAVVALVVERGFSNLSVNDMVASSGLARRTFFRYFVSKEDVLFEAIDAFGDRIAPAVGARPVSESVWDSLRNGMLEAIRHSPALTDSKQIAQLVCESDVLRARYVAQMDRWRAALADQLAYRIQGRRARFEAHLMASLAMAALYSAILEWHRANQALLTTLVERAFADARPVIPG
jgi:AcrR family transcriptional regulator